MADKPKDNTPAKEYGEVKVIKNESEESSPGKTPGVSEGSLEDQLPRDKAGKTPGKAEG